MDPALKASRSSMLSSASTPEDPDEDAPKAEEVEVYNRLHDHHLGLPVGVHDEAFADPLDGSLRFERIAMHRSLRLECEDESLNFSEAIRELSLEMREGVSGGFGLDVIEAGTSSVARTLVIGSEEERAAVVRAFEWDRVHTRRKMGDRRRGARQRCMSLGCVPCGGGAGRRRRPASAPAGEGHAAGAAAQAPRREVPGMEEAEAYAKELWDAAEPSARPSGTARPSGIGLARARQARSDTRSSSTCAALLWELLAPEGPSGGRGSASSSRGATAGVGHALSCSCDCLLLCPWIPPPVPNSSAGRQRTSTPWRSRSSGR
ncbi:unnamed protein product [Prorocentrum cordatum]|uniref:Uncharacterized protein n=1 Tax=Prorocentrum cordatum TaxID=2364126 RepID=A0ABN9T3D9_9DINO|nr:unnamed protein product [Polarella glacialis]